MEELQEPAASYQSFTSLDCWKEARKFKLEVRKCVAQFPSEEKFRMTDQLLRSSRSAGNNIAEGHGRFSFKDQHHFCIQARGSLSETFGHLIDAFDENYLNKEQLNLLKQQYEMTLAKLNGYIAYLRKLF